MTFEEVRKIVEDVEDGMSVDADALLATARRQRTEAQRRLARQTHELEAVTASLVQAEEAAAAARAQVALVQRQVQAEEAGVRQAEQAMAQAQEAQRLEWVTAHRPDVMRQLRRAVKNMDNPEAHRGGYQHVREAHRQACASFAQALREAPVTMTT